MLSLPVGGVVVLFGTPAEAALAGVGFAACPGVAGARFAGAAAGFAGTAAGLTEDGVTWDTALARTGVVLLIAGLFDFAGIGAGLIG